MEYELEAIVMNFEATCQIKTSVKDIFTRSNAKPFFLSAGLMLIQQLSGINAVIFYTVSIFKMAGSTIDGHISTIIVGVVNLLATFVANALIDKLGRKILVYVSSGLMVASLLSLGTFFHLKVWYNIIFFIISIFNFDPLFFSQIFLQLFLIPSKIGCDGI